VARRQPAPGRAGGAYKRWILGTAEQVAGAAREGGLFGVGGVPVSEREREVLDQLAGLLGLQRSA